MHFATVPATFAAATASNPARPVLTWYDDATGERSELSGATLANWVAKTANLLVDGGGLGRDDVAVVDLPPHWQTAAVLLGCWSAGLQVAGPPAEVVFAAADRIDHYLGASAEVYGLALAPMAAPMRQIPAGVQDYVTAVRAFGDHFGPPEPVQPADLATTRSHEGLTAAAAARAQVLGFGSGDRVLIDVARYPDPVDWLLAPLAAGVSTVLCANLDPGAVAGRVRSERVTRTLTG